MSQSGIDFAKEVIRYYSRSTWHRIREVITKPPRLGIDEKIAAITSAMSEIAKERTVLDSRRLNEVQQSLNHVRNAVSNVEVDVDHIKLGVEGENYRPARMIRIRTLIVVQTHM